jgi:hypothetical protein
MIRPLIMVIRLTVTRGCYSCVPAAIPKPSWGRVELGLMGMRWQGRVELLLPDPKQQLSTRWQRG